jgi:hypothetical protein
VVGHRLFGDAVQLLLEGRELARLEVGPGHVVSLGVESMICPRAFPIDIAGHASPPAMLDANAEPA